MPGRWVNRASALWRLERLDEALESYGKALALDPDLPQALESRANLLWTRQQALAPAIADLERALKVAPDLPYALGDLLHLKMHAGDWRDFRRDKARLDDGGAGGQAGGRTLCLSGPVGIAGRSCWPAPSPMPAANIRRCRPHVPQGRAAGGAASAWDMSAANSAPRPPCI